MPEMVSSRAFDTSANWWRITDVFDMKDLFMFSSKLYTASLIESAHNALLKMER
jgi:hypothetical protein